MVDATLPKLGLIGIGHVGGSLARSWRAVGVADVPAYSQPGNPKARLRADAAGARWLDSPSGLAQADIVISVVTPHAALDAARSCAPALRPDAIYLDMNSMGPQEKKAVAEAVQAAGRRFVDGALLGAAADGLKMPIIVSGPDAEQAAQRLNKLGMKVRAVGTEAGQAASIKIVRSVLAKGLEVIYVEALVAARRLGVEVEVLGTFCDWLDARPAAGSAELLVTTHLMHAERRMHELDMSIETVRQTGLKPVLASAIRDRLAMTAASGVAAELKGSIPRTMADALALLDPALGDELSA